MLAFLCIETLLNSNIVKASLKQYLRHANICTGSRIKSKHQLIEMIMYGFMCNKINDIPSTEESDKDKFKKAI